MIRATFRRAVPAWVAQRFATRRCTSAACLREEFHTAHLTAFGRLLYT